MIGPAKRVSRIMCDPRKEKRRGRHISSEVWERRVIWDDENRKREAELEKSNRCENTWVRYFKNEKKKRVYQSSKSE